MQGEVASYSELIPIKSVETFYYIFHSSHNRFRDDIQVSKCTKYTIESI